MGKVSFSFNFDDLRSAIEPVHQRAVFVTSGSHLIIGAKRCFSLFKGIVLAEILE
jgi:hypothetical protein